MATMNISVPDPMRDWVQSRIDSGKYASVSDYMRDLIRRDQTSVEQDNAEDRRWMMSIDAALERGLADIAAGRVHDIEDVRKELSDRYTNWPKSSPS